jgi:hypothetical protein
MRFVLGAALLAGAFPLAARAEAPTLQQAIGSPEGLKLSGSVRLRYETLDGQPRAGLRDEDEQIDLRSTLFAEYDTGVVRIGGELYDSRAWLAKPGSAISANEVNTLELVQAYVAADFDGPFGAGSKASVQLGRYTLNLGSRRLVAADDYRNTTNGYTGLRADLRTSGGLTATAVYVLPQVRLPDDLPSVLDHDVQWDRESFDLQLWGGYVALPVSIAGATAELGYFGLHERDWSGHATRNRDLDTFSARVIRDPQPGRLDFEVEGIYQTGTIRASTAPTAAVLGVDAWFVHADAGYTLPGPAKLRLSLEYDRASGDGRGARYGRFDTLFGMRRADLAPAGIYNASAAPTSARRRSAPRSPPIRGGTRSPATGRCGSPRAPTASRPPACATRAAVRAALPATRSKRGFATGWSRASCAPSSTRSCCSRGASSRPRRMHPIPATRTISRPP